MNGMITVRKIRLTDFGPGPQQLMSGLSCVKNDKTTSRIVNELKKNI